MAALTAVMVIIGGITRLTESGLSMVRWEPISGTLPPLTHAGWEAEFADYKQSPQYQKVMQGISLAQFKQIFFWEWFHRFFGRVVGIVAIGGVILFGKRALLILVWVVIQGVMGWLMVKSGLVDRPSVSHFRLAAHLILAFGLFAYCVVKAAPFSGITVSHKLRRWLHVFLGVLTLQIIYGAFVAGLDAGIGYNQFPKMGTTWLAPEALSMTPVIKKIIWNPVMIQFIHRWVGVLTGILAIVLLWQARDEQGTTKQLIWIGVGGIGIQIVIGVLTLLWAVPLNLAVVHQFLALCLVGFFSALLSDFNKS